MNDRELERTEEDLSGKTVQAVNGEPSSGDISVDLDGATMLTYGDAVRELSVRKSIEYSEALLHLEERYGKESAAGIAETLGIKPEETSDTAKIIKEAMAEGLVGYEDLGRNGYREYPEVPEKEIYEIRTDVLQEDTAYVYISATTPNWENQITVQLTEKVEKGELHLASDAVQHLERQEPLDLGKERTIRDFRSFCDYRLGTLENCLYAKAGGMTLQHTSQDEVKMYRSMGCWDTDRNCIDTQGAMAEYVRLTAERMAVDRVAEILDYDARRYIPRDEMEQIISSVRENVINRDHSIKETVKNIVDNSPALDEIMDKVGLSQAQGISR